LKASDIKLTVEAYRLLSQKVNYPLHVGITEAGTLWSGTVKSSIGIGSLLFDGLGDTIRVSLTGDPVEEIKVAKEILKSLRLRSFGVNLISCPTCGRCQIDLIQLANRIEEKLKQVDKPITVAIMGCAVNGPGEAREADIGIAGGKSSALLFKKGEVIRKLSEEEIERVLLEEIDKL
jgi:(E)-4-hydroxy-3-methylbut-2-enyl-diphosphate synthase